MVMRERLVDIGGTRCDVRVEEATALAGERELWCDNAVAQRHFDLAAPFYDFIMGWFEVPANRRAVDGWELSRDARVLELGVGTGLGLVTLLRSTEAQVVAVDRSPAMLARARKRLQRAGLLHRVTLLHADARALPFAGGEFHAVYSSFLLDLMDVRERRAVLAEARRVLRPRAPARFVVMDAVPERRRDRVLTSIYNGGYARWNPIWMALARGYAPHCRPVRLSELLEDSGFSVTDRRRARVTAFPVAIYHATSGGPT
jgi:ubiquinone/menaquinone biosynthesis C-methylase UbiE